MLKNVSFNVILGGGACVNSGWDISTREKEDKTSWEEMQLAC